MTDVAASSGCGSDNGDGPDAGPAGSEAGRRLHELAIELTAMSQNGLNYATDHYDIARYHRMREISAELLELIASSGDEATTRPSTADFHRSLLAERGHATPKVDVRAALFDTADRVLLVQEARDGRWTLPGGYADALDTPSEAAAREFVEEAGIPVRIARLVAVHDGTRQNAHQSGAIGSPWHIFKLMFLAERLPGSTDAAPVAGLDGETLDAAFFALDALPPLSSGRTSVGQLQLMLAAHRDPSLPTTFD